VCCFCCLRSGFSIVILLLLWHAFASHPFMIAIPVYGCAVHPQHVDDHTSDDEEDGFTPVGSAKPDASRKAAGNISTSGKQHPLNKGSLPGPWHCCQGMGVYTCIY
jgi:hypothetical protein